MRVVRKVIGTTSILFMLAGCAVSTQSAVAIARVPACAATLTQLVHPGVANQSGGRMPETAPGSMRLCRFRWKSVESKLILVADIRLPLAPVSLMHALSQLKTVVEVYGRNAPFSCPASQGNADVLIIRAAKGSDLTIIDVQRDGCGGVLVSHAGSSTYIAYLSSAPLLTQLDAIKTTL